MDYDYLFKILLIGDSGCGKSSILSRFCDDKFDYHFMSTIGVDFKIKNLTINDTNIKLQIWDTAGQERFRTITGSYYRSAIGIIIVFDLTDRKSFDNVKYWLQEVDKYAPLDVKKLLIGNKSDLIEERQITQDDITELLYKNRLSYIETSAKDNININNIFIELSNNILNDKLLNDKMESSLKIEHSGNCKCMKNNCNHKKDIKKVDNRCC